MRTVEVHTPSRDYPIVIGAAALGELGALIAQHAPAARRIALVADAHVFELHGSVVLAALPVEPAVLTFTPGESAKCLRTLSTLYDGLAAAGVQRSDLVVTLGGGVASDLGGYAAATWMRGIGFLPIATSLEAAIDASIGGKTAINHAAGKNLIGAFHQPAAVVVDTDLLATLPQRELRSALAESIKHAAIRDAGFFAWHERHIPAVLTRDARATAELIDRNCRIKAGVVEQDEREAGLRRILNYGHTIGHAIEHHLASRLRHGECVALGMIAENHLAVERGLLSDADATRVRRLIEQAGLPTKLPQPVDARELLRALRLDKKAAAGRVRYALLAGLGRVEIVENLSERLILSAIEALQP